MPKDKVYYMVMNKDRKPVTDEKFKNVFDANIYFEDHEESKYIVKVTEQILVEKVGLVVTNFYTDELENR